MSTIPALASPGMWKLYNYDHRRLGIPEHFPIKVYSTGWVTVPDAVGGEVDASFRGIINTPFVGTGLLMVQLMPLGASRPIDMVQKCKVAINGNGEWLVGKPGVPACRFHGKWIDELFPQTGPLFFWGKDDDARAGYNQSPVFTFTRVMGGETGAQVRILVIGFHPSLEWLQEKGFYKRQHFPLRWLAGYNADLAGVPQGVKLIYINGATSTMAAPVGSTLTVNWRTRASSGICFLAIQGYEYDATGNNPFDSIRKSTYRLNNFRQTILDGVPANTLEGGYFDGDALVQLGPLPHSGDSDDSPEIILTREQAEVGGGTKDYCIDVLGAACDPSEIRENLRALKERSDLLAKWTLWEDLPASPPEMSGTDEQARG